MQSVLNISTSFFKHPLKNVIVTTSFESFSNLDPAHHVDDRGFDVHLCSPAPLG